MRDTLTVTYTPKAQEQEDQRYVSYDGNFDISEELKPIESGEVLGLYLIVIDNTQLIVRATIGPDHQAVLDGANNNEILMGMRQNILIPGYIGDQTTLVNELGDGKKHNGLGVIKTFREACNYVVAINDKMIDPLSERNELIYLPTEEYYMAYSRSLLNTARIFADKM